MDEQALLHGRFLTGLGHIFLWLLGVFPITMAFMFGWKLFPTYPALISIFAGWFIRRHGVRIRQQQTLSYSKWL